MINYMELWCIANSKCSYQIAIKCALMTKYQDDKAHVYTSRFQHIWMRRPLCAIQGQGWVLFVAKSAQKGKWSVEELSNSENEKVIDATAGEENTYYLKGPSWKWVEADDFIINNSVLITVVIPNEKNDILLVKSSFMTIQSYSKYTNGNKESSFVKVMLIQINARGLNSSR